MAYRPTNDVKENIIHRNTIFDSQGMVSCCNCGYCIKKTPDATLVITNFKSAPPIINENLIGSNIIEFSDYMIPTGSFEYFLTPTVFPNTGSSSSLKDSSTIDDYKFSDGLTYYPFLRCTGIQSIPVTYSYLKSNFSEFEKYNEQYNSHFGLGYFNSYFLYSFSQGTEENRSFFDSKESVINRPFYLVSAGSFILYDQNQFKSFVSSSNYFEYNNTNVNTSCYSCFTCGFTQSPPVNDSLSYTPCENKNDFYLWSAYAKKNDLDKFFKGQISFTSSQLGIVPQKNILSFSSDGNFNLFNFLENGPEENYSFAFKYLAFPRIDFSDSFMSISNFVSGYANYFNWQGGGYDYLNVKTDDNGIISARTYWYESYSDQYTQPCSEQRMINYLFSSNPETYNIQSFFQPISTPLPKIDSGDYQTFFNYIDTNEYSKMGFKSESGCTNNIVKIMEPVFFKSFDDYQFSFKHENYTLDSKIFGITDKFITPNRTSWSDCHGQWTRANLQSQWVYTPPAPPEAITVQFKELNSTAGIYKKGYVLHSFNFKKDNTFYGRIGLVEENPFYAVNLDSNYRVEKTISFINDQFGQCGYAINRIYSNAFRQSETFNYFAPFRYPQYSSQLIYSNSFIDADPFIFIEYDGLESLNYYTNGLFKTYRKYNNMFSPITYYQDACGGFIGYIESLDLKDYFAQKTNRTKIISKTDSSGLTTVTIENVLWTGKTLLTETYLNNDGDNRSVLALNKKVPNSYDATLIGGFESDIEIKFQSIPICKKDGIIDRMKRVNQIKVNFEEYRKIPQQNTIAYDYENYFIQATPGTPDGYFNYNSTAFEFDSLKNIAYAPPDINPNGVIYLKNNPSSNNYSFLKKIEKIEPPVEKDYFATPGRVYADFGVPNRFKSCLLVNGDFSIWETGKEVKFGTDNTIYYSIFVEEIKDEKQKSGQSLIRIATTFQNSLDGIYIPDVGLRNPFKNTYLKTKILSQYEDVKTKNYPRYSVGYDPNQLDFFNSNAAKMNANYLLNGTMPIINDGNISIASSLDYPFPYFYWNLYDNEKLIFRSFDKMEIISFSPLKIKYFGCRFSTNYVYTYTNYLISNLITPDNVLIPDFITNRDYGFMCDIVIEEIVDEFIQEALPVEFNQILENVEYIQTSNLMNARKPLQMINPEKCEHIGKVIDRKDCNCPKKWVRECELHGKTDWKKCMTCKDFKLSE